MGRLGRRLLLAFVVISLVPLAVSNGLGYVRSEAIVEGLVQRYLSGIAVLQAQHTTERVDGLIRALNELGSRPSFVEAARSEIDSPVLAVLLERAMTEHPEFESLYLFDAEGSILASAPLPPGELETWIGPALHPPFEAVEVRWDSLPPRYPHLRLSVPIGDARGVFARLGATVTTLGPTSFLELPAHTAGSVETIIVDRSGLPVFMSHPHGHVDYGIGLRSPLVDEAAGAVAIYRDRVGVPVLGTVVPIQGQPWRLINEVPLDAALLELRRLRRVSLVLASMLAFVVFCAAWLMAGRIVAPVRRLVHATRRVGRGELAVSVQPIGRDEIGELGASFNRMTEQLRRASTRVESLHRREMERAAQLATVGELAAGVAHEIKNPVAGIAGGMDLIAKRLPADGELRQIADEMGVQVARINAAVRDLLTFARPAEPSLAPTHVNHIVERVAALGQGAAEGSGVTVEVDLATKLPTVQADSTLLAQCVLNLLMNAIQATTSGGSVRIATAAARGGVEIRVEDQGVGIPADRREHIFRPFFTTKHQGTGLGLPITAGIIERHGGRISVESDVGHGTTFTVWLPVTSSSPVKEGELSQQSGRAGR